MAKKLKDWYDAEYLMMLAQKIKVVYPQFNDERFFELTRDQVDSLEFLKRQDLVANALYESLDCDYEHTIAVFTEILGPGLPDNEGNFTSGYWLWPIGRYVEEHGTQNLDLSLTFSKELTKRFTSEYCMRPLIAADPDRVLPVLIEWSQDENMRVRRLASECIRIRLPWAKRLDTALNYFDQYYQILDNLKNDPDKYVKKSVANNLNDLYKEDVERFSQIVESWTNDDMSEATKWIVKHGSRSIK